MMPENIDVEVKKRNVIILTRHMQNALRFQRRVDRKQLEVYLVPPGAICKVVLGVQNV